jgi:uncharacterized protein YcbX
VPTVAALSLAPVKGMRLVAVEAVTIDPTGPRGDRAFHVREADGALALTSRNPGLVQVVPEWDADRDELALAFPGGRRVAGPVVRGRPVVTAFYDGRAVPGHVVDGPFAPALSEHLGRPVTLVARDDAVSGGDDAPVTLMSLASLAAVRDRLDADELDARRFRMSITIDGVRPWEEHGWARREVAIGAAVVRVDAPTERCVVTTRSPRDGRRDLPVLRALAGLRGKDGVTFGVWCTVLRPGAVSVGDAVLVEG